MTENEKNFIKAALDVAKHDLRIITISVDNIKATIEPEMSLTTALKKYEDAKIAAVNPLEKLPFSMPIEDVFYITGKGVYIIGKVASGVVNVGDKLEIVFDTSILPTKCIAIEKARARRNSANAGENISILISGISKSEIKTGSKIKKATNC